MVLDQIGMNATEQIDLKAWDCSAPNDRGDADQMRLATAGSAAVQRLSGGGLQRYPLFRVQIEVQNVQ